MIDWPESDIIDRWLVETKVSLRPEQILELKIAVSKPRLELIASMHRWKQTDPPTHLSLTERAEFLKLMKHMRKNGAQYHEIADDFNGRGFPTVSGRGRWHAQSVHRMLVKKVKK